MKPKHRSAILLTAAVLILWAVFSWPLPLHFNSGIPQSDRNLEKDNVRKMIPGDQLQLMYHFWLAEDMIAGKTPLFTNVYEFNRGDDDELYRPDPYYIPYSLTFAFFDTFMSRAAAWNLSGLLSIFLTFLSTYWLIKRITEDRFSALIAAILATTFPYRWITLLIGSPTGFGISLVPLTVLGLHIAIRDGKWTGGCLAGLALFLSYCSDLHVIYFNMLTLPFWTIIFLLLRDDFRFMKPSTWKTPALALLPAIAFAALTAVIASLTGLYLKGTDMSQGRSWTVVTKYSPRSRGLFSWENLGKGNHVFLGHITILIILIALISIIIAIVKKRAKARNAVVFGLILLAALCTVSLALGVNGVGNGMMMKACRALIPKYTMIRQSVKIFCLMPLFLSLLAGLGTAYFQAIVPRKYHPRFWICTLALLCILEWRFQISPTICLLADNQPAYAAVASDADEHGIKPHAVIVPLWPGDSHWSSLYEHYVSLYRIRMLNGYSPAIGNDYMNSVIIPLDSINRGVMTTQQVSLLKSMKIDYLIFHQDAYPDQVCPYPASQALFRFLSNPNLRLIEQSESIWAFKILPDAEAQPKDFEAPEYMVSMRGWELESRGILQDFGDVVPSRRASGRVLKLTAPYAAMKSRPMPSAPGQQMNLRVKGHGSFLWQVMTDDVLAGNRKVKIDSDKWQWLSLPFSSDLEDFMPTISFSEPAGDIYLDMMFLSAGKELRLQPGESVSIPAAALYGQGYINLPDKSVTLRKTKDQDKEILYGMFPLLEKGTYQIELDIECDEDVEPGSLVYLAHTTAPFIVPIEKPGKFVHIYKHHDNVPVKISFRYSRDADMTVKSLKLKRIE